ncbi:MAG: oligosaccharide flippase family protein, partial [Desulfuromonadales bacterium]|nr:oligosaccharide flippase family protein [Desulfuromonadales bacterium]
KFMSREVINVVTVLCQRLLCVFGFILSGVSGFYWGLLLATLLGLGLGLVDIRKYLTWRLIPFTRIFRESRSYFGLELLRSGLDHLDRPVIALFLGAEALAGYHVAKRLYENFYALIIAIVVPAGVKFGELRSAGAGVLKEYYRTCMIFITQLFIPLGFFLAVISPQLLLLYGGEKYLPNTPVLIAFGFTFIGAALWTTLREAALRLLSPKHIAYQYLISTVVTMGGYLVLLPTVGPWGIPVAMGLGYFSGLLPLLKPLEKEWGLQMPVRNFFTATGAGVSVSLAAIPLLLINNVVSQLVVATTLAGAIYISWLIWVGPVEAGDFLRKVGLRIRSASLTFFTF